jgi:hypothetical protein
MPDIEVSIEVYCKNCGAGLCNNTSVGHTHGRGAPYFEVNPCDKCLEEAREDGKNEGYKEGYADKEKELEKANP